MSRIKTLVLTGIAVVVLTLGAGLAFGGGTVEAHQGGKFTICHITGSAKNPTVEITVSHHTHKSHGLKHGDSLAGPDGCP